LNSKFTLHSSAVRDIAMRLEILMRFPPLLVLALAFAVPAFAQVKPLPTARLAPAPANPALALVQSHLRGLTSMTADFMQTGANGQSARGKLLLLRPGRIRFEYEPSVPTLIVGQGNWLTLVNYDTAQVQRWPIKDTPLSLLLDPNQDISKLGRIAAGLGALPGFITVEASDPKRPQFGSIKLFFEPVASAPGGLSLAAWQVLDAQGNTTTIQLTNVRLNVPVSASQFSYRDPRQRSAGGKGS
jgi:outer membrane lipoprotein-sorting protein